jgi:hypothetical protein
MKLNYLEQYKLSSFPVPPNPLKYYWNEAADNYKREVPGREIG